MLGAIIGDLAGSIYEFGQVKNHSNVKIKNIIEDNAFFSDDTILTVAIADAIINHKDYADVLREYGQRYAALVPTQFAYFKTMFSRNFMKWLRGEAPGTSCGNGAMMRVSPVGYLFNTKKDVEKNARLATIPSHNTKEAISAATTVALIIYYTRKGYTKRQIIDKLHLVIKKPKLEIFNYKCSDTIDVCLYSVFTSSSFTQAIRKVIYFGGDTDTNACIVGSMAEAMFGISDKLKRQALSKLPPEFAAIVNQFYTLTKSSYAPSLK